MKFPAALNPLLLRWRSLDPGDQTWIWRATLVVGLAVVWWTLVAPPLRTLRLAPAQQVSLDAQWQKMQNLQVQAQALQAQPKISRDDALRGLEVSVRQRLAASGQLNVVGDRATLTLRNAPADALAQWLAQTRMNARLVPSEARLVRNSANPAGPASWDGTVILNLPAQQ